MTSRISSVQSELSPLAQVVKEAATVAQTEGGYLGRTAIQKIVYFQFGRGWSGFRTRNMA